MLIFSFIIQPKSFVIYTFIRVYVNCVFYTTVPSLILFVFHVSRSGVCAVRVLICIFLITKEVEHLKYVYWPFRRSLL